MGTELVPQRTEEYMPALTVEQAVKRYNIVAQFVRNALEADRDFGVIPGTTGKKTLLKPGAEKLCTLFGLSTQFELVRSVEDWTGNDHGGYPLFSYVYRCKLSRLGQVVAEVDGACNSWESKYRYRKAERKCPKCGKSAIIKGNEQYGGGWVCWKKKDGCNAKFADNDPTITSQQVGKLDNPDPADQINTIIKMAEKRAMIAAVLIAVNASDFFTQDLEDIQDIDGEIIDATPIEPDSRPAPKANQGNGQKPASSARPPVDGLEFEARLRDKDARLAAEGKIQQGALIAYVRDLAVKEGISPDFDTWNQSTIEAGRELVNKFLAGLKTGAAS